MENTSQFPTLQPFHSYIVFQTIYLKMVMVLKQHLPYKWMNRPIKKVAIVGGASSRKAAPILDPSWEIWGLGPRQLKLPRVDRWFEMHSKQQLIDYYHIVRGGHFNKHWKFLKGMNNPVYMIRVHASLPNSVAYPLEPVIQDVGRCFTSSVAYMLGLAIHEKFEAIGMWGVNMASKKEYKYQWPGVQYLLALAKSRGIHVYLPDDCPITIPAKPELVVTQILYGYDYHHPDAWWNQPERQAELKKKMKENAAKAKRKAKRKKEKAKRKKARAKARAKSKAKIKRRKNTQKKNKAIKRKALKRKP